MIPVSFRNIAVSEAPKGMIIGHWLFFTIREHSLFMAGGTGVNQRGGGAKISRPIVVEGATLRGGGDFFLTHYFLPIFFAKVTLHVL